MKHILKRIPPGLYRHLLGRLILLLLLTAALALQWWTWVHRYPLIAQQQAEAQQINKLAGEVQQMELKWSAGGVAKAEERLKQACEHLFSGDANTASWLEQVNQPTNLSGLAINAQARAGQLHPRHTNALLFVPTLWEVKPAAGGPTNMAVLDSLLGLLQDLTTNQPKRMDLVDLTVSGDGSALTQAQAGFRLWFRKNAP